MDDTNQGTLRDYLRVLRNSRLLILAVTLLCAGIAAGLSFTQEKEYVATARVSFLEENRSNAEAGLAAAQTQTPAQLAAEGASTMLSNDVLERARARLQSSRTIVQLRAMLATSVDPSSALVAVQASAGDGQFAAALANEVARGAVTIRKNTERQRFARSAARIERQYEQLRDEANGTGSDLALASLLDRISTLRTLSLTATPARLAETATVPSSPASPKPVRSTVFGGLIGLMLGIGLAFARSSLDRRLRDSNDIQEALDLPVVGFVRVDALGGAACIPNGRGPMADEDVESFRILRTNLEFLDVDRPMKSILVTSPQPGEGKSTVAASLAAANALAGKRTLLVECDLRRPVMSERLSISRSPGLSDHLAGRAAGADIVQVVKLTQTAAISNGKNAGSVPAAAEAELGELHVIAAGSRSVRPAELLGSQRFHAFIKGVSAAYDTVVIDTPPLLAVSDTLTIVPLADSVLLCIRADQTTRDQARAVKDALAHLPERTTAVVVTGLKPGRESDYGYYSHAYYGERRSAEPDPGHGTGRTPRRRASDAR
ncbi:MAG: Wzz/FepE/Etk N-terminal domain-containing protein [Actinomycetota bacterium]|nr:Wzz/FepE/Etk N-terminal domain-containing protein [Actinomycetota bacterium]